MLLVKKVIFHLFSLFEGLKPSDNLVVGVVILAIGLILTGLLILIRTYIRSCISEIVNKELEKNPKCVEQREKIQSLIRRHEEINNLIDEMFPRKFVLRDLIARDEIIEDGENDGENKLHS